MAGKQDLSRFLDNMPRGVPESKRPAKPPHEEWMAASRILNNPALAYDHNNPSGKILLGCLGDQLIGIEDPRHAMTVGGSASGKSVSLIGNLLCTPSSALVTDPKGKVADETALPRKKMGQDVHIIDPFKTCSDKLTKLQGSFNPLSILLLDNPYFLEDCTLIAESLVVTTKDQKDPHWDESAKNFIEGVIAFVATAKQFEGERHLVKVRELLQRARVKQYEGEGDEEFSFYPLEDDMMEAGDILEKNEDTADIGQAIMGAAIDYYTKGKNEGESIHSTVMRHTKFLDYKAFKEVLCENSFSLSDLKTKANGVTVYLCFPATRATMSSRWMRLFVNLLLNAMEREKTVPKHPVLFCLDEFPVLGFMPTLQTAIGICRGFHVKIHIILQDWSQGKMLYGEGWESFSANCGVMQFFGNYDVTTTEYISRKLGKTLVKVQQGRDVTQRQRDEGISGRQEQIQFFDLLTPAEIAKTFDRDDPQKRQLILWAGKPPMVIQRHEYFDENSPLKEF